jgi:hypothetical protein
MNKENIFFNGSILGLGDSIAVMPLIEIYANINKNKKVFFSNKFYYLFYKEYKNIFFLKDDQDFFTKNIRKYK